MSQETFVKLRRQAKLQVHGRTHGPTYELLPHEPYEGFGLMPPPDPGDVFFDMEGDPMFEPGRGLEYLFGCWMPGEPFKAFWGVTCAQEKRAFEEFVDFVIERRRGDRITDFESILLPKGGTGDSLLTACVVAGRPLRRGAPVPRDLRRQL